MSYLNYKFEDSPSFIQTFDEAPLWSAAFGLLLLKHIELKPEMTIVDIGSGTGFPLLELAGRVGPRARLYGIDPWQNAVMRARQKIKDYGYTNVELIESSAEVIPLENNSTDLVVSNLGINNFDRPEIVFGECHRILKPGGKLALTTNINGHWQLFYDIFENTLRELNKTEFIPKLIAQQERRGTVESVSSLFSNAGFTITKTAEEKLDMKFADGTAFLNHHFVKVGWLGSFFSIVPDEERKTAFTALENNLNRYAQQNNGLNLEVPMVLLEGRK